MSILNAPFFDFKSGILTEKIIGRQDLKILKSGLLQGHNTITQVQGGQEFRPGFLHVCLTRRNLPATMWPFVFNDDQAFVLGFTDYYMRFYAQEGVITETAKTITGITQASPGVITIVGHGYSTGDEVYIEGVGGMTELNGAFYLVVRINNDTFSLTDLDGNAINTGAFTAFTSGGTTARVYEIATPYTQIQAEKIMMDGINDVQYLVDGVHMPRKLTRLSNTNWTLASYTRTNDPFEQKAITGASQANPASITCVGHGFSTGDEVFIEDIVGMTQLNNRYFVVTVVDPDTFTLDGENSTSHTAYTSGGIVALAGNAPRAVGLYGGRLFFGGGDNDPDVVDGSMSPDTSSGAPRYDVFTLGSDPEDAISQPIQATGEGTPRIRFFVGTRSFLAVGTFGGMSKLNGGQDSVPISAVDIGTFPVDSVGVAEVRPASFGNDIIYVQRGSEVVLSFQYSVANDGFEGFDTTLQSDELMDAGIRQMAYQQGKPNLLWVLLNDGKFRSLTYRRSEAIVAWNTHEMGGAVGVISLCGEPQSSNQDRLWACVKRTINGVSRYMVEVSANNPLIPKFKNFYTGRANREADKLRWLNMLWEAQRRQVFLDSALTFDNTQTTTLTPGAGATTLGTLDVVFTAGANVFTSDMVGQYIYPKYSTGSETGIVLITEYTSPTQIKGKIEQAFASLTAIASGSWYITKTTISGLDHLEGEEVTVVEDGAYGGTKTVEDGSIDLNNASCCGVIGKSYTGIIETMPIELLLSSGITSGKYKSVGIIKALLRDTLGVAAGSDVYHLDAIKVRTGNDIAGRPAPYFSGYTDLPGFDKFEITRTVTFVQEKPFPFTLLGLVVDTEVGFGT